MRKCEVRSAKCDGTEYGVRGTGSPAWAWHSAPCTSHRGSGRVPPLRSGPGCARRRAANDAAQRRRATAATIPLWRRRPGPPGAHPSRKSRRQGTAGTDLHPRTRRKVHPSRSRAPKSGEGRRSEAADEGPLRASLRPPRRTGPVSPRRGGLSPGLSWNSASGARERAPARRRSRRSASTFRTLHTALRTSHRALRTVLALRTPYPVPETPAPLPGYPTGASANPKDV